MDRPLIIACDQLYPGVRLRIYAEDPTVNAAAYDRIQVFKYTPASVDPITPESWDEISDSGDRPVLGTNWVYQYEDPDGSLTRLYRVRYYHSGTGSFGPNSPQVLGDKVGYISISDARASGVPATVTDATLIDLIQGCQSYFDEETGKWFEPREADLMMDGMDMSTLFLPVPIISIYGLYRNSDFTNVVSSSDYVAYKSRQPFGDRKNPRVSLLSSAMDSIFSPMFARGGRALFLKGEQNQKVSGVFGWIETDGSTPMMVRRAVTMMVVLNAVPGGGIAGSDTSLNVSGPLTKKKVDRSEYWYAQPPSFGHLKPGVTPIVKSQEVNYIIDRYRNRYVGISGGGNSMVRWR